MKKISMREFQLQASKYLENLPVTLTRYNVPVAVVTGVDTKGQAVPQGQVAVVAKRGFCQMHFEQGAVYPLREVVYEDNNGEATLKKNVCPMCLEKLVKDARREGTLFIDGEKYVEANG